MPSRDSVLRDASLMLLAAVLVALYVASSGGGFALDDSWIHQTFARNLAQSGEWSFIPGQPTAASTSPLYTLLLSLGYRLQIPYALWTHALGVLALGLAGGIAARMATQFTPDLRHAPLIAGLAVVLAWHHIWAAASGMETMLFATLTLLLLHLAWREVNASEKPQAVLLRGGLFGGFTALATLARPEGVLLGAIVALLLLLLHPQGWRGLILWGVASALTFALLLTPYLLLNLQLTGGLLPDTADAKFQQHAVLLAAPYWQRLLWMLQPLLAGGQILLLPGALYFVFVALQHKQNRLRWLYLLPLLWGLALIALYAARLPAAYQHGRYVLPALPALIVVGTLGTLHLLRWGRRFMLRRVFTRALALAAAITMLVFALVTGPTIYRVDVQIINQEMVETALWIRDNLPPDDLLAIHDIGAVGYFAPREMLDIAGLVSPQVIPIVANADALWRLMQARDARYLMAFPDQIPGDDPDDPRLCPLYVSDGETSQRVGGPSMAVYRLSWGAAACPPS
jgi:hypothetical protein